MKPIKVKMTESQIIKEISQNTGWGKKTVKEVLQEQASIVHRSLVKGSIKKITIPFIGINIKKHGVFTVASFRKLFNDKVNP